MQQLGKGPTRFQMKVGKRTLLHCSGAVAASPGRQIAGQRNQLLNPTSHACRAREDRLLRRIALLRSLRAQLGSP